MEQEEEPDGEARHQRGRGRRSHLCQDGRPPELGQKKLFAYADKTGDALKAALVVPPARSDELNQNPLGTRPRPPPRRRQRSGRDRV